jgi:membrane protein implicated in regulation of membrane protease activity
MEPLTDPAWIGLAVAVVVTAVVVGAFLRYRALERAGSGLPPGVGGARLVGVTGEVVADHVPPGRRGRARVLGEEWALADDVTVQLRAGSTVRVTDVVGTRLVVEPLGDDEAGRRATTPAAPEDREGTP